MNTLALLGSLLAAAPLGPGDHDRTVMVGRVERSYHVHVPGRLPTGKPVPVVLVFHGGASNVEATVRYTGMNAKADASGFVVVYPQGSGRTENILTWNAGLCCGYAQNRRIDDVAFVRALLDDLATVLQVDAKRVYATGISNGGLMSYRLADELSDRIAAIAPVAGTTHTKTPAPKRAVPVLHIHGTADEFCAYNGGPGKRSISRTDFFSVDDTLATWVKVNGCGSKPTTTKLPDETRDGMTTTRVTYAGGRDGAEVVLLRIEGGGHTWPGHVPKTRFLGASTRDFDVNDAMWEFFVKHPMP